MTTRFTRKDAIDASGSAAARDLTGTASPTPRSSRRGRHVQRAFSRLASATVLAFAITMSMCGPASAAYTYTHTDSFAQWDSTGSRVYMRGGVNWYKDGWLTPVYRGQYAAGGYVVLNTTGCLWVKVTWNTLTGTASWPPSASSNAVSDGYYRSCGPKGTFVYLTGVAYASRALYGSKVCLGFSDYATYTLRRYDSCHSMRN
jgi:hypothetical protein